jgi:low affinity Fe/Cu permease
MLLIAHFARNFGWECCCQETFEHPVRCQPMQQWFDRFTTGCARFIGRPAMLIVALLLVLFAAAAWVSGHDRLEWAASLSLASVAVLLLPILQATQNRDGAALHAKLDELIKTDAEARDAMIGLEQRSEEEIEVMRQEHRDSAGQ